MLLVMPSHKARLRIKADPALYQKYLEEKRAYRKRLAERAKTDPEVAKRLRARKVRYHAKHRTDPEYQRKRRELKRKSRKTPAYVKWLKEYRERTREKRNARLRAINAAKAPRVYPFAAAWREANPWYPVDKKLSECPAYARAYSTYRRKQTLEASRKRENEKRKLRMADPVYAERKKKYAYAYGMKRIHGEFWEAADLVKKIKGEVRYAKDTEQQ